MALLCQVKILIAISRYIFLLWCRSLSYYNLIRTRGKERKESNESDDAHEAANADNSTTNLPLSDILISLIMSNVLFVSTSFVILSLTLYSCNIFVFRAAALNSLVELAYMN